MREFGKAGSLLIVLIDEKKCGYWKVIALLDATKAQTATLIDSNANDSFASLGSVLIVSW